MKPWRNVVEPREDLRLNRPFDASEFAVHLDQVRDGRAPDVYGRPREFFGRTFLTQNLLALAAETVRRLSGEHEGAAPVFNLATQFGGGKTHALTLLYHLAAAGPAVAAWPGVHRVLDRAGVPAVPAAAVATFVGQQFDSITGRGGDDGTPLRRSPWGEIAWQLGGEEAFRVVAEHDRTMTAPGGDVVRAMLPADRPALILLDELMKYMSRFRAQGWGAQLYNFIQNLSEEARGRTGVVLAVSIPASSMEMNAADHEDYARLEKLVNRVGKPMVMSAEDETAEIIRRRLFEWDEEQITQGGRVMLPKEGAATCREYAAWVTENRRQLPEWFGADHAEEAFRATYPFHPALISVFERKWQALPQFQRTRGVLQMLAIWVARAYSDGNAAGHKDPLIGLGTAPLDDSFFRSATFEQLGEDHLEGVVTTDITGRAESHADRRDQEAVEAIRKGRLHRKVATAIFFESNGGQLHAEATVPEIRLAVAEPGLDIGHVETVLETLAGTCYYLEIDRNTYRFSLNPNLNKLLSDRRATIGTARIEEEVRGTVQRVIARGSRIERRFFPTESGAVPNRPVLTLVVLPPDMPAGADATLRFVDRVTREAGESGRTYKSALIWCGADRTEQLYDESRRLLALRDIRDEYDAEALGPVQWRRMTEDIRKAESAAEELVWRAYRVVLLLGADNEMRSIDLGITHSSASDSFTEHLLRALRSADEVLPVVAPTYVARHWTDGMPEWNTRALRDAFYASPRFPRLLDPESVKETIARGVADGTFGYAVRDAAGAYAAFHFQESISPTTIEISDDACIVTRDAALAYQEARRAAADVAANETPGAGIAPAPNVPAMPAGGAMVSEPGLDYAPEPGREAVPELHWHGTLPRREWMRFYQKVLDHLPPDADAAITVDLRVAPPGGIPASVADAVRAGLREMGLGE